MARQGDGATLRTHLQRLAANTRKVDPRLTLEWPQAGRTVWDAFCGMARQAGMGMSPISCTEIDSWQRLHGIRLTSWEIEMIRVFDGVALEAARKADK